MSKKKTLMLLNLPYPPDIRVGKETQALSPETVEIHLVCLRRDKEVYEESLDGISVHRIDAGKNNYGLAFWDIVLSLFFIHPVFFRKARQIMKNESFSALHVHDLPLAGTAFALRKKFPKVRVVVDFHENYPDALRTWFQWKKNPIARIKNYFFMNPDRWMQHEKSACLKADHIIAVVEEMKQRITTTYSINESKVTVVTNSEGKSFSSQPVGDNPYAHLAGKFILTYSGGIGPHRGIDTAIQAMSELKGHPIHLVVVGSGGRDAMKELSTLVDRLALTNVEFWGHQPFSRFLSIMKFADVNIIPHHANEHTDHTIPHKLFQSMQTGKPVLVSSVKPLRRIVEQWRCGLVFEAGSPIDFAKKVLELFRNQDLCRSLGKNGVQATLRGPLNWENEQKKLIAMYEQI
jgi:glycosyltransferase involved in cell wall biosynthesis